MNESQVFVGENNERSAQSSAVERRRLDRKAVEDLLALGDLVALIVGGDLLESSRWRSLPHAWAAVDGKARWPDHAAFPALLMLGDFLVDLLCYSGQSEPFRYEIRAIWQKRLRECINSVRVPHEALRAPFILAEIVLRVLDGMSSGADIRLWRPGPSALIVVGTMQTKGYVTPTLRTLS